MRIGIGIPSPDRVHPDFAIHSLTSIISYTKEKLPDVELLIRYQSGVRTDRNRNVILDDFLDENIDKLLWLDADQVYNPDIIERFLEVDKLHKDPCVIGCLYFKRTPPHTPIGYIDSGKKDKPFRPLMPQLIKKGKIYEVTGLGYGGMMVDMEVYKSLGENKWTRYGKNFHDPNATEGNLTHDLQFCRDVRDAGYKLFLHGSVRPGHIGERLITEQDFYKTFPPMLLPGLKVAVVMPTTDPSLAQETAAVLAERANYACDIQVIKDESREGFVATVNNFYKKNKDYDFYVYVAQDVFVGQNWLSNALLEQFKHQVGLVGFNDGKWSGQLASFGMVEKVWVQSVYKNNIFFDGYKSHYADTELTQIAKQQGMYVYCENSIMLEIDYKKAIHQGKGVNKDDKLLYAERKKTGFDGLVSNKELINQFS